MLQRSEKVVRKYQQSPRIKSSADGYVIILEMHEMRYNQINEASNKYSRH
jgi:hypothetical protein